MMFKEYFYKRSVRRIIKRVTKQLFSENNSLLTEEDRNDFLNQFVKNKNRIQILTTYLAIITINRKLGYESVHRTIDTEDIDEILAEVNKHEEYLELENSLDEPNDVLDSALNLHLAIAMRELRMRGEYFQIMKKRYKATPNTFEVQRYIREKAKKRPLTISEQEKCREFADTISQFDDKIEDLERKYNEHITKLQAQATIDEMKREADEHNKKFGKKSPEEYKKEREEIMKDMKQALNKAK